MTPLVTVSSDDPLGQAAQLMAETAGTHLAVIDSMTHRPVGVRSTMGVARVIAEARSGDRMAVRTTRPGGPVSIELARPASGSNASCSAR